MAADLLKERRILCGSTLSELKHSDALTVLHSFMFGSNTGSEFFFTTSAQNKCKVRFTL